MEARMRGLLILLALVSSTTAAQADGHVEIPFLRAECTWEKLSVFRLDEPEPTVQEVSESSTLSSFVQEMQWGVLARDREGVIHRYEPKEIETPDGPVVELESKFGRYTVRMSDGRFVHTFRRDLAVHVVTGYCILRKESALIQLAEPG